eukprot:COSAG02_NODE_4782_length_4986_cov_7.183344_1_plen_86_part_00
MVVVVLVVVLFEELVGWLSWFRAVTHERWARPLVWTTLPFRAEPMCEAERTHHPTPKLEELVRSTCTDLQFVIHLYKMLCFRHID